MTLARQHVHLTVDGRVVEVQAALEGKDLAGSRIDGNERRVVATLLLYDVAVGLQHLLHPLVVLQVKRRVHLQACLVEGAVAKLLLELVPHVHHPVRGLQVHLASLDVQLLVVGRPRLFFGDCAVPRHLLEDVALAVFRHHGNAVVGTGGVAAGRGVQRRRLHQAGDERRFSQVQVVRRLAEVALGGGLHAVALVPEVDAVQVHLEDLVLGVAVVDLIRERDLAQLASHRRLVRLVGIEHGVADQLLGDRRGARGSLAGHVDPCRAERRQRIDARVLVEVDVLGRQERLHHVG